MTRISSQYLRFLVVGALFTVSGPSVFLLLVKLFTPWIASLISELCLHSIRFAVYNRFLFGTRMTGVRTYISAAMPMMLLNSGLVFILQTRVPIIWITLLIAINAASIGYWWTKACYKYDVSSRYARRSRVNMDVKK